MYSAKGTRVVWSASALLEASQASHMPSRKSLYFNVAVGGHFDDARNVVICRNHGCLRNIVFWDVLGMSVGFINIAAGPEAGHIV